MTELALRVVCSLAVVVGMILVLSKLAGRRFKPRAGAAVQVLQRQQLSRGSAVTVVTVGGRVLVLGMTEQQVSLLTELDPSELEMQVSAVPDEVAPTTDADAASTVAPARGPLAGSVLSPQTWRQAVAAVSGQRRAP